MIDTFFHVVSSLYECLVTSERASRKVFLSLYYSEDCVCLGPMLWSWIFSKTGLIESVFHFCHAAGER